MKLKQLTEAELIRMAFLAAMSPVYGEGDGDGDGDGAGDGDGDGTGEGSGDGTGDGSSDGDGDGDGDGSGDGSGDGDGDDGGKKPTDEEARLLKENMKRKANEKALKEKIDAVTSQLQEMQAAIGDLKPDDVKALIQEKNEQREKKLRDEGAWDKLRDQMVKQHEQTVEGLKGQIEELQSKLQGATGKVEELTVGRSFSDSAFISERTTMSPSIARTLFGGHFDVEDGTVVAYDKPRGAEERTQLIDDKGNALGFDAALQRLVEGHQDSKHLLRSEAKPGAGSGSGKKPTGSKSGDGGSGGDTELRGRARIVAGLNSQKG